jgi:peptidyl-prolyl cis-trans isomerase SurA
MKAGEVTDVIRTKQGYVILKVTDHQMAGIPPMKEIEPKIQDALYYEKLQPALRAVSNQTARRGLHRHQGRATSIPAPARTRPSRSKPPLPSHPTRRS